MTTEKDRIDQKIMEGVGQLSTKNQKMLVYILENKDELLLPISKLNNDDEQYLDKVIYLVETHKMGYEVDVVNGVPV